MLRELDTMTLSNYINIGDFVTWDNLEYCYKVKLSKGQKEQIIKRLSEVFSFLNIKVEDDTYAIQYDALVYADEFDTDDKLIFINRCIQNSIFFIVRDITK